MIHDSHKVNESLRLPSIEFKNSHADVLHEQIQTFCDSARLGSAHNLCGFGLHKFRLGSAWTLFGSVYSASAPAYRYTLNNPFLLSLLHQLLSVLWSLDLTNGFLLTIICHAVDHFHLVDLCQCLRMSLHQL